MCASAGTGGTVLRAWVRLGGFQKSAGFTVGEIHRFLDLHSDCEERGFGEEGRRWRGQSRWPRRIPYAPVA
jgi:hypothetical protein